MSALGVTFIEIPSWGNATLIEAVWLLTGVAALGFTLAHLRQLRDDHSLASRTDRPVLRRIAFGYYRRELIRLVAGGIITAIGVYATVEPSAVPGPARVSLVGLFITAGFVAIAAANAVASWWDWHDREQIQSDLDKGLNGHAKGGA